MILGSVQFIVENHLVVAGLWSHWESESEEWIDGSLGVLTVLNLEERMWVRSGESCLGIKESIPEQGEETSQEAHSNWDTDNKTTQKVRVPERFASTEFEWLHVELVACSSINSRNLIKETWFLGLDMERSE